jgi:SNF2 family DNA or RNA helicase
MLRRRKDHMLNGKPILQLPERTVNVVQCNFDTEEHAFYMALENKMSTEVDKLMTAGEAQKNYTNIIVMLLRLRQGAFAFAFAVRCRVG